MRDTKPLEAREGEVNVPCSRHAHELVDVSSGQMTGEVIGPRFEAASNVCVGGATGLDHGDEALLQTDGRLDLAAEGWVFDSRKEELDCPHVGPRRKESSDLCDRGRTVGMDAMPGTSWDRDRRSR